MSFGQKLRKLRKKFNMTQENVADCIHVSRSTIAGYETKNRQPSHEKLTALADLFQVPVDYLLDDTENEISLSPSKLAIHSEEEISFLLRYRNLSLTSKRDLDNYLTLLEEREQNDSL